MRPSDQIEPGNSNQMRLLQINPSDNIAVATMPLHAGQQFTVAGVTLIVPHDVPLGAKLALRFIDPGDKIVKYGEPIGSATAAIQPGGYVHTHNLSSDYLPTPKKPGHED